MLYQTYSDQDYSYINNIIFYMYLCISYCSFKWKCIHVHKQCKNRFLPSIKLLSFQFYISIVPVYMSYITDHVWIQYKMYMYMQKYSISYYFIKWKVQTTSTFLYMYIVHKYIWCGRWISLIPFAWFTNEILNKQILTTCLHENMK